MRQTSKPVAELEQKIHGLLDEIDMERDELELKILLARAEVRAEWEKAEKTWQDLKAKADMLRKETRKSSGDNASRSLARELKHAYSRINRQLKQL